jgi:GTPase SAR1 family protein
MPCCGGGDGGVQNSQERERAKDLDGKLYEAHQQDQAVNKLLLLGAGESGKSTLFKQMKVVYGTGFGEDRSEHKQIVWSNAVTGIKELVRASEELKASSPECAVSAANAPLAAEISELKDHQTPVDSALASKIEKLWKDPGIVSTFERRHEFQLPDSAPYFLDRIATVGSPDYVPSDSDILHSRVRTTGIVEDTYKIDGNIFKIFDVGGQRTERKKWIHCFSEVTAMLFVAALSAYNLKLYEEESTNRMAEALKLFHDMSHLKWFEKTSIILFLNKTDLFKKEIKKTPLTVADCLKEYKGPQEYEPAAEFIKQRFEAEKPEDKRIFVHFTCATDSNTMKKVFDSTKEIVIARSLDEGGLGDLGY